MAGNRLVKESSPYLRQHAHNPVDWYPWGPEALARARAEQKPIFLSIGYAACHWCHVMERESFEDPEIAAILNRDFICIKVDREERPDLDQIYMAATVALTRRGGWPMSVFLTPSLKPFYAGTYFPPEDRYGMPSFRRVLLGVLKAWQERREEVLQTADAITEHLREADHLAASGEATGLETNLLREAGRRLRLAYDADHGGFGQAPKFPHPLELKLLLRLHDRFGGEEESSDALNMVTFTLERMAAGGIYDQLGGGFARYSTDDRWLVPHFEKMLYDNALLVQVYLEAYLVTGQPRFRHVITETLGWVAREMTSPEGAFYSSLDADSEGEEGKFYVWSQSEIEQILGPEAALFCDVYDVTPTGNWEGHNILHRPKTPAQDARLHNLSEAELENRLAACRAKLLAARSTRPRPGLDDKILTAWNALLISALTQAGSVLDEHYVHQAAAAADFLLTTLRQSDGRLYRTYHAQSGPRLNGYLEDYAFLIEALTHLFEATLDGRWLHKASRLADVMIAQFWDETGGGFFFTGKDHEPLILRNKEPEDNAVPSGNSVAALGLLRLAHLLRRDDWRRLAERTLQTFVDRMAAVPMAYGQMLAAVDFYLGPVREYVIAGDLASPPVQEALRLVRQRFDPRRLIIAGPAPQVQHYFQGRTAPPGDVTVWLCAGSTCEPPLTGLEALRQRLEQMHSTTGR
jgi:uncharacterized protein YyaL (SSP411 family)